MKCKNIECENETTGKRVYCSLTCRNIFVNKYLRNYDKVSDTFQQKKKEREGEYLENPKYCKECNQIIPFDKIHDNEFYCSRSCSALSKSKDSPVVAVCEHELWMPNKEMGICCKKCGKQECQIVSEQTDR